MILYENNSYKTKKANSCIYKCEFSLYDFTFKADNNRYNNENS